MKINTTALFRSVFLELIVRCWRAYNQLRDLKGLIQQDRRWLVYDRTPRPLPLRKGTVRKVSLHG